MSFAYFTTYFADSFVALTVNRITLSYVLAVLHNVAISEGAHADENAQFIQLSFTMPDIYTAAGDVIPFTSVRVGKAQDKDSIEEWYYPCGQSTSDASTIYGTAGIADLYETMAQASPKTCPFKSTHIYIRVRSRRAASIYL